MDSAPTHVYDIFVAYADLDASWVNGQLLPALGLLGSRCITHETFVPGAPLASEFERAVRSSRYTVLVLSPAYLRDEWTKFGELLTTHVAVGSGTEHLIPVLLEDCEPPLHVDFRVRLDCRKQANWEKEIARLRQLLETPEPAPFLPRCPYPGIIPFGKDESPLFFGREQEIGVLAARVAKESLIVVVGPSGSGKSSLVFAGLVPKLEEARPGYWMFRSLRPGAKPRARLAASFEVSAQPESALVDWKEAARALLNAQPSVGRLLLIVDQFEEVFSQSETSQRDPFASALQDISAVPSCAVLLTMRADFYPQLLSTGILSVDPSQQMNVRPLLGAALRDAIVQPAAAVGVWLEEKLVDRLIADVGNEPGILPMLQETMILLWNKTERRLITLNTYLSLDATRPGLMVALALQGAAALSGMGQNQRRIARRALLRLVQFGEGTEHTRRQQRMDALRAKDDDPADFSAAIDRMVAFRILTLDTDPGDSTQTLVDLAHEALIAGWPLLVELASSRRDAEMTRRLLYIKAEEWKRLQKGKRKGGFLDAAELAEAQAWMRSSAALDVGIDRLVADLIDASIAELRRQKTIRTVVTAVTVVFVCFGLAGILKERAFRSEDAYLQRLEALNQLRAEDPGAALRGALEAVSEGHRHRSDLAGRAAALLEDSIQSAEPYGRISIRGRMFGVAFSRDGKWLAAAGSDGGVGVRNLQSDELVALDPPQDGEALYAVQFSPDGRTVAAAGASGVLILWNPGASGPGRILARLPSPVMCLAYSPAGDLLAAGRQDGAISLLGPAANYEKHWQAHPGRINRLAFSANGALLAAAASDDPTRPSDLPSQAEPGDSTASVWEVSTGAHRWTLGRHTREVTGVAFGNEDHTLATVSADGYLRTWDMATGTLLAANAVVEAGPLSDVLFAGPDEVAVSQAFVPQVTIWNLKARSIVRVLRGDRSGITAISYHAPDPRMIAAASLDGKVRVYYLAVGGALAHADNLVKAINRPRESTPP
jgi:hypothetical protein